MSLRKTLIEELIDIILGVQKYSTFPIRPFLKRMLYTSVPPFV